MTTTFSSIQKNLDKEPVLYLEKYPKEFAFSDWEIEDFILQFLVSLCNDSKTFCKGTDKLWCNEARRRSISDIYLLCKYYYDNVTLAEVQSILAKLTEKGKIGYFYCNATKKRVYMSREYYKSHTVNPVQYGAPDEYGISPADIKKMVQKDYKDFL